MRRLVVLVAVLAGCPAVDLGDTPSDIGTCYPAKGEAYFESTIWPSYINNTKRSCVPSGGCHDQNSSSGGRLHFITMPPDLPANYRLVQPDLDCTFPTASLLYTKPCGIDPHQGGPIFTCPSDPEAQLFLAWF